MSTLSDRERVVRLLRDVQSLRDSRMNLPVQPMPMPPQDITLSTEKLAEWLVLQERPGILALLKAHAHELLTPRTIALLILLRRADVDATWRRDLAWRCDLLIRARQVGIDAAWREVPPPN